jgi:hypothetical protein
MVVGNNELTATQNAGKLLAILIVITMQRYNAGRIARWSTSMASLEAAGSHHRVSACALLPRRLMVNKFEGNTQNTNKTQLLASNYDTVHFCLLHVYENFGTQNGLSNQLIDATSFV